MDLTKLSDVELALEWKKASKTYPSSRARTAAIDVEASKRGGARMKAAFDELSRSLDPEAFVKELVR